MMPVRLFLDDVEYLGELLGTTTFRDETYAAPSIRDLTAGRRATLRELHLEGPGASIEFDRAGLWIRGTRDELARIRGFLRGKRRARFLQTPLLVLPICVLLILVGWIVAALELGSIMSAVAQFLILVGTLGLAFLFFAYPPFGNRIEPYPAREHVSFFERNFDTLIVRVIMFGVGALGMLAGYVLRGLREGRP